MRPVEFQPKPPWALDGDRFEALCTRCNDCIEICPTRILRKGAGGFPVVDFAAGECLFCAECVKVCTPHALQPSEGTPPWLWVARIGTGCLALVGVECRVCGEACGQGAIRFRPRLGGVPLAQLDAAACTGCGACVAPCPSNAILMEMPQ